MIKQSLLLLSFSLPMKLLGMCLENKKNTSQSESIVTFTSRISLVASFNCFLEIVFFYIFI